jgi:hypothetical protein
MKYFENLCDCQHIKVHKTASAWVSWSLSNAGEYYWGCAPPRYQLHEARGRCRRRTLSSTTLRTATMKLDSVRDFFRSLSNEYSLGVLSLMLVG